MTRLEGTHITIKNTKEGKQYIGKRIQYLRSKDIDKTGRGYYFPKTGIIEEVYARNIRIDGDWTTISELVEIILL